jgi:hypothetical protein
MDVVTPRSGDEERLRLHQAPLPLIGEYLLGWHSMSRMRNFSYLMRPIDPVERPKNICPQR